MSFIAHRSVYSRGLTLIEVVLSLGILSVVLLSLLAVFTSGLKLARSSDQATVATTVGQEFMELVRARGFGSTAVGVYDGRLNDPPDPSTGFPFTPYPAIAIDHETYTLVVTCEDVSPTLRSVKVDVYWDLVREGKLTFYTIVHI